MRQINNDTPGCPILLTAEYTNTFVYTLIFNDSYDERRVDIRAVEKFITFFN